YIITTDNASNMKKCVQDMEEVEQLGCTAHTLQLIIGKGMKPEILIARTKQLIDFFIRLKQSECLEDVQKKISGLLLNELKREIALQNEDEDNEQDEQDIIDPSNTSAYLHTIANILACWNSSYIAWNRLLLLKNHINVVLNTLGSQFDQDSKKNYKILQKATDLLRGSNYCIFSIINPILTQIKKQFAPSASHNVNHDYEEFDKEWWPLVSNIWTNFSHKNNVNGNSWEVFICRFNKPKKSSTRKEEISQEKCCVTKIRPANLCFAKIKIYRYAFEQKVLIERFKDSPDHSHTLEESEKLKRSQTVQNLVMQEAIKNYRPPEIVNAVKEYATEKLDLGESVKELRQKEVTNIKYKVRGALNAHLVGNSDLNKEDSVTIAKGLKIARRFAHHWSPRYFLSDQSNIESNSIRMAFPGLKNGEQDCDIIFCTVYIMRTWMNKIYDKKTRQKMIHAMHKRTKIGCKDLVQQAINECSIMTIKNYITRNYTKNIYQWALWARQHSPLLLQVTSTNALESYHSELKRLTFSQHGACHKIVELDKKKCSDSEHVAYEFRVKRILAVGVDDDILQEIHKFPFPVQQMLISEFCAVKGRMEKGKSAPGLTSLHCYCLFFHRYLLPCRHIFHEHAYGVTKLLTSDVWEKFQRMFDKAGFDIYISRGLVDLEVPRMTEAEKATENRRLAVSELMERVRDMYWRVEETGNIEQTGTFIRELKNCIEPVLNNQMV
ncbi:hypothetical protein RclHR1_02660001, partial [Rhizophagus clarus]